jgi:hypothetical protein
MDPLYDQAGAMAGGRIGNKRTICSYLGNRLVI